MRRPSKRSPARKSPPAPPIPNQGAVRGVSLDQASHAAALQRRRWVIAQFGRGMSLAQMIDLGSRAEVPLDSEDVKRLYREVHAEVVSRVPEEIQSARAEQINRLRARMVEVLAGEPILYQGQPTGHRRINFVAVLGIERLYMQITGTAAPTKIRLDLGEGVAEVGQQLAAAIAGMGEDRMRQIVDEQRQREQDASEFRKLKLLQGGRAASSNR